MSLLARAYSALYVAAAPAIAAYLLSRPDSRERWRDYAGRNRFEGAEPVAGSLWVHAVSAGEVLSVATLAGELRRLVPELTGTMLTTTIADALRVARLRAPQTYPSATFLPLDLRCFLRPLLERAAPRAVVISETDFWPNLLLMLRERDVPVYLVNGRISEKAGRGYRLASGLLRPALEAIRLFYVQREEDRARLVAAGVDPGRIRIRPNTKYERPGGPPPADNPQAAWLRGAGRPILVAGSTHAPEERLVLDATRSIAGLVRVIAPRNPGRVAEVRALSPGAMLWSERPAGGLPAGVNTIVVDTMGELDAIYAAADAILIGGSFGKHRGHNFLEAAWHGKPIVCGPDMANFAADVDRFEQAGALRQVGAGELRSALEEILRDPGELGPRARRLVEAGQGVSARIAEELAADMSQRSRRPLRVLFTVSSGGLGGGERHVVTLAKALAASGRVIPSVACQTGGWLERSLREASIAIESEWALFGGRHHLVHAHLNWASARAGLASWLTGTPCVATVHGVSRASYYRFARCRIAVSGAVREHLERAGLSSRLIYTGLPPLPPAEPERVAALRGGLGLDSAAVVFLAVGKLHPNKNQALLLEAAKLLPTETDWRVLLVGSGPDEPRLRAMAGPRVVFAGEIDDPPAVLALASVLVVPSHREAFGLAALEAQLAGVPVIASDTGGLRELVTDRETGRLFPPGDARSLAGILSEYLEDRAPFATQAPAARAHAAKFSVERMVEQTLALYAELAGL